MSSIKREAEYLAHTIQSEYDALEKHCGDHERFYRSIGRGISELKETTRQIMHDVINDGSFVEGGKRLEVAHKHFLSTAKELQNEQSLSSQSGPNPSEAFIDELDQGEYRVIQPILNVLYTLEDAFEIRNELLNMYSSIVKYFRQRREAIDRARRHDGEYLCKIVYRYKYCFDDFYMRARVERFIIRGSIQPILHHVERLRLTRNTLKKLYESLQSELDLHDLEDDYPLDEAATLEDVFAHYLQSIESFLEVHEDMLSVGENVIIAETGNALLMPHLSRYDVNKQRVERISQGLNISQLCGRDWEEKKGSTPVTQKDMKKYETVLKDFFDYVRDTLTSLGILFPNNLPNQYCRNYVQRLHSLGTTGQCEAFIQEIRNEWEERIRTYFQESEQTYFLFLEDDGKKSQYIDVLKQVLKWFKSEMGSTGIFIRGRELEAFEKKVKRELAKRAGYMCIRFIKVVMEVLREVVAASQEDADSTDGKRSYISFDGLYDEIHNRLTHSVSQANEECEL